MTVDRNILRRFFSKVRVNRETGCWEWTASKTYGYGQFGAKRIAGTNKAHRFSYLAFVGVIPNGTEIDHVCRNRGCVNPTHLEAVSRSVNMKRIPKLPRGLGSRALWAELGLEGD